MSALRAEFQALWRGGLRDSYDTREHTAWAAYKAGRRASAVLTLQEANRAATGQPDPFPPAS